MALKKMPFITSVSLAQIHGRSIVPTVVYYDRDKRAHIGSEARENSPSPEHLIEDFKLDLGLHDPDAVTRKTVTGQNSPRSTVVGIAQDFFREVLSQVSDWLEVQGRPLPKNILIAEPLSLSGKDMADESWLSNYRKSIKRALYGKFDEIDFMPEPFAVFQYYRYGLRHPVIAEQRKHIALVLDFGGGTFDISVIETTKTGDVSKSGVNSRPLGATSVQVGGYYINRMIAEDFLLSCADKSIKADIRKSIEHFNANKNPDEDYFVSLAEKQKIFRRHYKKLLETIEGAKVSVCNSIANWSLHADLSGVVPFPISVPINPYVEAPQHANLKLDAGKLRTIFEDRIWNQRLKSAIEKTIQRASIELKGQTISVVLLSGGSSNIRWLTQFLKRDLDNELRESHVIELNENFQEIVAKGLATECARRFFTEGQGDFRAVTYNRLCLALKADGGELEIRRAKAVTEDLQLSVNEGGKNIDDGVLLPSASSLKGLVGKPLIWKIRLSSPPKHFLEYFFLRSSFDPDDLEARHNIVDTKASTPRDTKFQQAIEVELTVREDGTAEPRFIYSRSDKSPGVSVAGRPFHIDMTFAQEVEAGSTYLGFDFGTSASACSIVDSKDVHLIDQRNRAPEWKELTELAAELPYPVAVPLARFVSEADQHRRESKGREAAEALLTLATFIAYADTCSTRTGRSSHLKGFQHRSAGPLWGLLRRCLDENPAKLTFAAPLLGLMKPDIVNQINVWIAELNAAKHGQGKAVDWVNFLGLLANHIARIFQRNRLGIFENVTAKRFASNKYRGLFRILNGGSQAFVHVLEYEGETSFSDENVYVVDPEAGKALCLSPLYYWGLNRLQYPTEEADLFELDNFKDGEISYKGTQLSRGLQIRKNSDLDEIYRRLEAIRAEDPSILVTENLLLRSHEVEE